jgi:hypothetical protein
LDSIRSGSDGEVGLRPSWWLLEVTAIAITGVPGGVEGYADASRLELCRSRCL